MDGIKGQGTTEVLTEAELKREFRRLTKLWHPDVWDIGLAERSDAIVQVVSRLFQEMKDEGLTNYDVWPSKFEDGYRVAFPAFTEEEFQKISAGELERKLVYLPSTPREFLTLLNYIEHNGSFPNKQFPKVPLSRSSRGDVFSGSQPGRAGFMDQEFADEFARFKAALGQAGSIERLQGLMGALDVLPPGTAEDHKLNELIDGQAEYLLSGALISATDERAFEAAFQKIRTFPLHKSDIASRLSDLGLRTIHTYFKQLITRAASSQGLEKITERISHVSAEIPESKAICEELLHLANKKKASYSAIWQARKASKGIDK